MNEEQCVKKKKLTFPQVLGIGIPSVLVISLAITFLWDSGLPKTTLFMEIAGRSTLIIFGILFAYSFEEEEDGTWGTI